MDSWRSALKADVLDWLLEESAPSVRYQTLKSILDRPEDDKELKSAKKAIMAAGIVPAMLDSMRTEEYTATFPRFYLDKYKGLSWQLIILSELAAESTAQVKEYCEYLLANSQERESGGFSIDTSVKYGGGRKSTTIPCLTGNMIFALSGLGYSGDEARAKGGGMARGKPTVRRRRWRNLTPARVLGDHSCYMGVVKALKGFAGLPEEARSARVGESIERGAEFLLKHHVYRQSHDLSKPMKPGWTKFSFPLMYQTDALEILLILSKLEIRDGRTQDALDLVISKQNENGTWTAQDNLKGKLLTQPGKEEQDKWVTLRALSVIKYYNT